MKKWKLISVVAVSFLCIGYLVAAQQGSIEVSVKDNNNKGIAQVQLKLNPGNLSGKTNNKGVYTFKQLNTGKYSIQAYKKGYQKITKSITVNANKTVKLVLTLPLQQPPTKEMAVPAEMDDRAELSVATKPGRPSRRPQNRYLGGTSKKMKSSAAYYAPASGAPAPSVTQSVQHNTEEYDKVQENEFKSALKDPLSTFSIDVDTASYSNVRRFLNQNRLPYKDAVRIEEFINYFTYDYKNPTGKDPFSINTEISDCPWNRDHRLVHIGLQGKRLSVDKLPPFNLVFLLDVSGSMNSPNKLPLLKSALKLLVNEMRPEDSVAITVYAGSAGLVLPPTTGKNKGAILNALDRLQAGGSTAGGAGIKLAYKVAKEHFVKKGNNRIILATDGDFNVGQSSDAELVRLIEEKRNTGVFLTILGFGMGNYKDSKMEKLADKGNGNYAYIDNILEAKKVLVTEIGSTLQTIAKDVKIQVEFNPAKVKGYRLVGYENRMLKNQDFNDDKKDAGELGAGHSVTVLYEIIPAGSKEEIPGIDKLKYQSTKVSDEAKKTKELLTVKLRYKKPDGDKSTLIAQGLIDEHIPYRKTSTNFRFSSAVAEFGLLLRDSKFKAKADYESVLGRAKAAKGQDKFGYRAEFLKLVEIAQTLSKK